MSKAPVDLMLDAVEWKPVEHDDKSEWKPGDVPYATHTGVLDIFGAKLECVVLNTGQRLFTAESIAKFFGELDPPKEGGC